MSRSLLAPMRTRPGDLPDAHLLGNTCHHDRHGTDHEVPYFAAVIDNHEPVCDGKGHTRNVQLMGT